MLKKLAMHTPCGSTKFATTPDFLLQVFSITSNSFVLLSKISSRSFVVKNSWN